MKIEVKEPSNIDEYLYAIDGILYYLTLVKNGEITLTAVDYKENGYDELILLKELNDKLQCGQLRIVTCEVQDV